MKEETKVPNALRAFSISGPRILYLQNEIRGSNDLLLPAGSSIVPVSAMLIHTMAFNT